MASSQPGPAVTDRTTDMSVTSLGLGPCCRWKPGLFAVSLRTTGFYSKGGGWVPFLGIQEPCFPFSRQAPAPGRPTAIRTQPCRSPFVRPPSLLESWWTESWLKRQSKGRE